MNVISLKFVNNLNTRFSKENSKKTTLLLLCWLAAQTFNRAKRHVGNAQATRWIRLKRRLDYNSRERESGALDLI